MPLLANPSMNNSPLQANYRRFVSLLELGVNQEQRGSVSGCTMRGYLPEDVGPVLASEGQFYL